MSSPQADSRRDLPSNPDNRVRTVAFVDVDQTLLNVSTLADFASFYFRAVHGDAGERRIATHARTIERVAAAGADRLTLNLRYYELWSGEAVDQVREIACRWHEKRATDGDLYRASVIDLLDELCAQGTEVVLVSGSFTECLEQIAQQIRATTVLCTSLMQRDGRYTGEVARPMIGSYKAQALGEFLSALPDHDLAADVAIGDHLSDLPMLEMVGRPVVVAVDQALIDVANERGWTVLDA